MDNKLKTIKMYKKQIMIGIALILAVLMWIKMTSPTEGMTELEVLPVVEVLDSTLVAEPTAADSIKWSKELDSTHASMEYWYGVLDTNSDGDIDNSEYIEDPCINN